MSMSTKTMSIRDIFWALVHEDIPWRNPNLAVTSITSKMPDGSDRERLVAALRADEFAPLVNARVIYALAGTRSTATDAWLGTLRRHDGNYVGIPIVEGAQNDLQVTFAW